MFFYLKTGGGHLAPARAVAEKIKARKKGEIEIILADGLLSANTLVKRIIEDGYKKAVNKAVWTFELLYALHKIKIVSLVTSSIVSHFVRPGMENQILSCKPDKIVIFHFFLIKPVYEILKKYNLEIPVLTVVTDPFTAHPIWFLQKEQNFVVFSEMLKERCIKIGIIKEKLQVFPFVLDQKYSRKLSKNRIAILRSRLGFRPDSKVILIMGGGDGMPRGKKILKNIVTNNIDAEIAIVCGNNLKMYKHVIKLKEKYQLQNIKIYGFVDFIHSLINISDVVITKCGASTFMEILLLGKVQIINNYIWEQEKGNMEFVCINEMGILEKDTSRIPKVLEKLFNDSDFYNHHITNIRKSAISNGVGQVSDYILGYNT
jgi:1,2-diacylglycerol 3-beta-galactosyltransferase